MPPNGTFGAILLGVDLMVKMPGLWVLTEGPVIIVWALILNVLVRRVEKAIATEQPTSS